MKMLKGEVKLYKYKYGCMISGILKKHIFGKFIIWVLI